MANARLNMDKALYDTLNTQTVNEAAPGGVFNTLAPQGTLFPYIIFQLVSKIDDHTFNGRFAEAVYMVKAVADSPWPYAASTIDTAIDTALEDTSLTVTGYTHLLCRRTSDFDNVEDLNGKIIHHVGGYYRIIADEA